MEPTDLELTLLKIYGDGRYETFEDGMDSDFGIALEALISLEGNKALEIIKTFINSPWISYEVFCEGLIWIGRMDDENQLGIWEERRLFLEYCLLQAKSGRVKDGAGLGLSFMDDPKSIPILKLAVDREVEPKWGPSLKLLLKQVLDQLIETEQGRIP